MRVENKSKIQTITFKQDRRPTGHFPIIEINPNEALDNSHYTGTVETYYAKVSVTAMRLIDEKKSKIARRAYVY
jgi:hypothetical protein